VLKKYKRNYVFENWQNVSLSINKFSIVEEATNSVQDEKIKSVSFHAYNE